MRKCLYCYGELEETQKDFHPACCKRFFGTASAPVLPYSRADMSELARRIIRVSTSVTGVQAKMSLDIDKGKKNEPARFSIVGLWGKYIFKPQSSLYPHLPELEDVTMKMAKAAGISCAEHSLIRLADGEIGYITKRMDRDGRGRKKSMLDFCQLSNRLTEHKYYGTYEQLAQTVKKYSAAPLLDLQRFWEVVLFSWITGNSDMHCKNFSLIESVDGDYTLSPAYDLLPVLLVDPEDTEEMALAFTTGGPKQGFSLDTFTQAMTASGLRAEIVHRIVHKMISHYEVWISLIESSFLSDNFKQAYKNLLEQRLRTCKASCTGRDWSA